MIWLQVGLLWLAGGEGDRKVTEDVSTTTQAVATATSSAPAPVTAEELTLEELFPEKSFFGPSAYRTAFSHDGRYAAYLYRPYKERRHGSDLWLLDTSTGTPERITSVSVMARYQKDTREVRDDRIKKAKKHRKEQEKKGGSDQSKKDDSGAGTDGDASSGDAKAQDKETGRSDGDDGDGDDGNGDGEGGDDDDELGDWVSDDDADDEKAPRYGGIQTFTWSPVAAEMLLVSDGDIYRYDVAGETLDRLTRTRERERDVQYLPDGSGYTYMRDGALLRVSFGSHIIEQLDPQLDRGERMTGYALSPDGTRIVFRAEKEGRPPEDPREVKIAQYTDRFMTVRTVRRQVSDDPRTPTTNSVYLYELNGAMKENGKLWRVHSHEVSGPRDVQFVPEWAPDSSRVVFAVYEQDSGHVDVLEADFPERDDDAEEGAESQPASQPTTDGSGQEQRDDDGQDEQEQEEEEEQERDGDGDDEDGEEEQKGEAEDRNARVVYRFLHFGGPNTPYMMQPYYLADSRRIVLVCEQTGFRQLHVLDPLYQALEPLTLGRYEIYPIDVSQDHEHMFVTATREDPSRREVYRVSLSDGTMTRLSQGPGDYSNVAVSDDGTKVLANHVTFGDLEELAFIDGESGEAKELTDSHPEKAHRYTQVEPEFFTYRNRHGHEIHGHMFLPDDFSEDDRRPLLIYVYGGPLGQRKMVVDGSYSSDGYFFAWYMARKHGYVTCTIDPRGTSGYGGLFEKANFEQVGKPQVEDLVDGVKWFVENYGVDKQRVAIHGWSFGGFQTQMCLYTEPDVFAAGMAGAGPTEWENYNSWYSTGTIGPSREGHTDLEKFSLLPLAKNLKAKLLLVHGMEDANVLYQDTVRVYRELLKAGKETLVELFLDPTGGHGLGGDVKRLNRMRKYEEFLLRTVGAWKPPGDDADTDNADEEEADRADAGPDEGKVVTRSGAATD